MKFIVICVLSVIVLVVFVKGFIEGIDRSEYLSKLSKVPSECKSEVLESLAYKHYDHYPSIYHALIKIDEDRKVLNGYELALRSALKGYLYLYVLNDIRACRCFCFSCLETLEIDSVDKICDHAFLWMVRQEGLNLFDENGKIKY